MNLDDYKSRELVPVKCSLCGKETSLQKKRLLEKLRVNSKGALYCSRECSNKSRTKEKVLITCACCGKEFTRRSTDIGTTNYCSKSCAAKVNGKLYPKRKKTNEGVNSSGKRVSSRFKCNCGNSVYNKGSTCRRCLREKRDNKTLGHFKETSRELHFALIQVRNHARKHMKSFMGKQECAICGYSTYVEICHRKPIRDFPDTATLKEINSLDNLLFLCPNHHKELDLGMIIIPSG